MKDTELVIGKEYWFSYEKKDKGFYIGVRESTGGIYFNPIGETSYYKACGEGRFKGMVGFINGLNKINPV